MFLFREVQKLFPELPRGLVVCSHELKRPHSVQHGKVLRRLFHLLAEFPRPAGRRRRSLCRPALGLDQHRTEGRLDSQFVLDPLGVSR